ncbi:iron uptake transporter permease EfeU (plasmid) [Coraliomargarita sp. W4R53]
MLATFLIGLREGLEAALVVGILVAYISKLGRREVLPRLWIGVGLAVALSLGVGAILTFGAYSLTFQAQEIIGGTLSILAVAMVTWMIFWMQKASRSLKATLEGEIDKALAVGTTMWGLVAIGFVSVAREGIESALLLWSMVQSFGGAPSLLFGAVLGLVVAVFLGWLLARGMVRLNLRVFFTWTSAFLIVVAAGVLAYGIHDLQEAGVLPGPFTASAPIDAITGAVAAGWSAFPFGWAFDVSAILAPGSTLAVILQATVGFMPAMTWLQVIAWTTYVVVVGSIFVRRNRRPPLTAPKAAASDSDSVENVASTETSIPATAAHQGAP